MQLSLVVVSGSSIGAVFDLEGKGSHVLGSSPGCSVRLVDVGVADQHARFELGPDGWVLTDLCGEGFWINGVRKRHALIQLVKRDMFSCRMRSFCFTWPYFNGWKVSCPNRVGHG